MTRLIVFDVNETLLDLHALQAPFARVFGDVAPQGEWFARLLHGSLVATLTDSYEDFEVIGRRALDLTAARQGLELSNDDREEILGEMRRLPLHPEVPAALHRLRHAGFRLATLTNSSYEAVRAQLEHAGLAQAFDEVLSVEDVRRFKPAPEAYLLAAERLGVEPAQLRLVSAHDWDVSGATHAGCSAAFVDRAGVGFGLGVRPEIVGPDLTVVAERIVASEGPAG